MSEMEPEVIPITQYSGFIKVVKTELTKKEELKDEHKGTTGDP